MTTCWVGSRGFVRARLAAPAAVVRASMVSSTLGAVDLDGRVRIGEESGEEWSDAVELGFRIDSWSWSSSSSMSGSAYDRRRSIVECCDGEGARRNPRFRALRGRVMD